MVWIVVAVIIILTAVAMVVAARIRDRQLERTVRVEITNRGNVKSSYQLRVEDPDEVLSSQFMLDGDPLPGLASFIDDPEDQEPARTVPSAGGGPEAPQALDTMKTAARAQTAGSGLARVLATLGSSLPRSVGGPLLKAANQLRQGQSRVRRVQWYSGKAASVRRRMGAGPRQPLGMQSLRRASSQTWSETPSVRPGYTLAVDLVLRSAGSHEHQVRPFQVVSRSVSGPDAPLVIKEGDIEIRGGFWARRFLPRAVLLVVAAALLALAAGLATAGIL
jgi:hypothetical protein